jgi:2-oxoglutarate dehydrogenase E1 component
MWCQEEPINQGAWFSIQYRLRRVMRRLNKKIALHYAGREAFAAPAVGYASIHLEQQQQLVKAALVDEPSDDMENGH